MTVELVCCGVATGLGADTCFGGGAGEFLGACDADRRPDCEADCEAVDFAGWIEAITFLAST